MPTNHFPIFPRDVKEKCPLCAHNSPYACTIPTLITSQSSAMPYFHNVIQRTSKLPPLSRILSVVRISLAMGFPSLVQLTEGSGYPLGGWHWRVTWNNKGEKEIRGERNGALWCKTAMNRDGSTRPLFRLLTLSLAPRIHSLTHSLTPELMGKWMIRCLKTTWFWHTVQRFSFNWFSSPIEPSPPKPVKSNQFFKRMGGEGQRATSG